MGDDGKLKGKPLGEAEEQIVKQPEKTEEQLMAERLERYKKDPHSFIEFKEIILCALRNPKSGLGISVFLGNCNRTELDVAQIELTHICNKMRLNMDIQSEMKRQAMNNLIVPGQPKKHGILDFARRK
jgi:hypothetical protein